MFLSTPLPPRLALFHISVLENFEEGYYVYVYPKIIVPVLTGKLVQHMMTNFPELGSQKSVKLFFGVARWKISEDFCE